LAIGKPGEDNHVISSPAVCAAQGKIPVLNAYPTEKRRRIMGGFEPDVAS